MFRKLSVFSKRPNRDDRRLRRQDSISSRGSTVSSPFREHVTTSEDDEPGPIGLNVIYTPRNGHKVDIVFVHGLGGTSRHTWSRVKDAERFWPLTFLPLEPDICLARILTFGYNSALRKAGNGGTSMLDFAKDLLFDLKYGQDERNEDLRMGNVPLIFVVHSMGGLIVKEAYMQGQHDPEYAAIIKAVAAISFLATPHRGTNLAQTLNRILQSSVVSGSKQFVSELGQNSLNLQKLNEQFRHVAPKLDIVSFYETQPTPIGLKNTRLMILEKDSSILGYPGETSKALDADHHGICKYDSPKDPNYVAVRNVLKSLVSKILATNNESRRSSLSSRRGSADLKSILAVSELPATDYSFFRDQWTQGTSDWVLHDKAFLEWRYDQPLSESGPAHRMLWLNGGPASGKSVLSSFIINNLVQQSEQCQYFFIRHGDRSKRTMSSLLRSIAFQVAQSVPDFFNRVTELADEGIEQFETTDARTLWERIYRSILFNLEADQDQKPLFWVIDGVDEAENPRAVVRLLADIVSSTVPIRLLLASRKTPEVESSLKSASDRLNLTSVSMEDRQDDDLRRYVDRELSVPGNAEFRDSVIRRILAAAQNNFLWVRLAVETVNACHREADVEMAFQQLPVGMEALYDRMASSIAQIHSPADRDLALTILRYTTCSMRGLTVAQLSQALGNESSGMLDLQHSIMNLCGGFVVVDNDENISLIHQTAREYLVQGRDQEPGRERPVHVDRRIAHEQLFSSCMRCLTAVGLRGKLSRNQIPEYLDYAATSWSSHLSLAKLDTPETTQALKTFLTRPFVLTWIEYLGSTAQLRTLIQASKHLSKYAASIRVHDAGLAREQEHILELELFESWATDFVKIVGKFGTTLQRNPTSIYKQIPPFCPRSSSIYQLFGRFEAMNLTVSGLSSQTWDDLAARISVGDGDFASSIVAAGSRFFVLATSGNVLVYDCHTFEESAASPIKPEERVYMFQVNNTGTLLTTYGYRTTKVWNAVTGDCRLSVANLESRPRPLAMQFVNKNTALLVGFDDRKLRSIDLQHASPTWESVASLDESELDGHFLNAASYMVLNHDGSLIAVAYRGHPLSAWETDGPTHIGHCWRKREVTARGEVIDAAWLPHSPEILGLYIEGVVFKWSPYENEVSELTVGANRLTLSNDGKLFATGNGKGAVKVFTTSGFGLLYQLVSQDTVLDLAFSPNSRRFYDIRGEHANAWEPNALLSFADHSSISSIDNQSDRESVAVSAPMMLCQRVDTITTVANIPKGQWYFSGTVGGAVYLHHAQRGQITRVHASRGFLSIEKMACSNSGKYLAFCDTSRRVFIMAIVAGKSDESDPIFETKAEIAMRKMVNGPILGLLFHPASERLLVQAASSIHVVSLSTFEATYSREQVDAAEYLWIVHPLDSSLVMALGASSILIFDWDLIKLHSLTLNDADAMIGRRADRALVTRDKKHMLVQTSPRHRGGVAARQKRLLYFPTSSLSAVSMETPAPGAKTKENDDDVEMSAASIAPAVVAQDPALQVARILAFLSHGRLVFLSRSFSICSWQFPSGVVTELFSLPRDWINGDYLSMCDVWNAEKSLICPRNGEVAVVRCAALA